MPHDKEMQPCVANEHRQVHLHDIADKNVHCMCMSLIASLMEPTAVWHHHSTVLPTACYILSDMISVAQRLSF